MPRMKETIWLVLDPSLFTERQHISMQGGVHAVHGARGPGSSEQMLGVPECLCDCACVDAWRRARYEILGCFGIQTEGNEADEGTYFRENFGDAPHGEACLLVAFELCQLDVFT